MLCDREHVMWLWTCYVIVNMLCDCEHVMWLWTRYVMIVNTLCDCEHVMWLWTCYVIVLKSGMLSMGDEKVEELNNEADRVEEGKWK